jgi:tetratricopeptide (TPR) repeat protein
VPKITDFGLAKCLGGAAGQTRTGEVLGTPGYMAPEQSRGPTAAVGPTADVYALGAILYEILTGRPPFRGETLLDTMLQARSEEPVPPRRLQPKVPRDLETICLTCLRTEPRKRYASAAALAEDLRRFRAGEPVRARPAGAGERALRWARRQPALAASLAATALAVLGLLAGVAWHNVRLRAALADKQKERDRADANARVANDRLGLAVGTLKTVFEIQRGWEDKVGMQGARQQVLRETAANLERLSQSGAEATAEADQVMMAVHLDLGDIFMQLGRTEEAYREYQRGHRTAAALAAAAPDRTGPQGDLASSYDKLGDACLGLGRTKAAEGHYRQGLEIRQAWASADRNDNRAQENLVASYSNLGRVSLELGATAAARDYFRDGLKIALALAGDRKDVPARRRLLVFYGELGHVSLELGDKAAARGYFRKSLELSQALPPPDRDDARAQSHLTALYRNLGRLSRELGEPAAARDYLRKGLQVALALAAADRDSFQAREGLLPFYGELGAVCLDLGEPEAARDYYRQGLPVAEALAAADRGNARARWSLAVFHGHLGDVYLDLGEAVTSRDHYRKGLELVEALAAADRNNAEAQRERASFYGNLGNASELLGETVAARDYYRQALRLAEALAAADPKNVPERQKLLGFYLHLGEVSLSLDDRPAARDYSRKGLGLAEALAADPSNAQAQWALVMACQQLAELERQAFEYPKALLWFERALAILRRLEAEGKHKGEPHFAERVENVTQGVVYCRAVPRAVADENFALAHRPGSAAELLLARAAVLARRGRHAEAAAAADKLRAIAPREPDHLYHLARCCARCLRAAAPGEPPGPFTGADRALRERLAANAVGLLREAVAGGYRDHRRIEKDPDLDPLRQREDFKKVIRGPGEKPAP